MSDNTMETTEYTKAKRIVEAYESKEPFDTSFWFMLSNHTFYKFKSNSIDELEKEALEVITLDGYGMLCHSKLSKDGIEMKTVGKNHHGNNGTYDIKGWINDIKKDLEGINYKITQ